MEYDLPTRRLSCPICEVERDYCVVPVEKDEYTPEAFIEIVCPVCGHIAETIDPPADEKERH